MDLKKILQDLSSANLPAYEASLYDAGYVTSTMLNSTENYPVGTIGRRLADYGIQSTHMSFKGKKIRVYNLEQLAAIEAAITEGNTVEEYHFFTALWDLFTHPTPKDYKEVDYRKTVSLLISATRDNGLKAFLRRDLVNVVTLRDCLNKRWTQKEITSFLKQKGLRPQFETFFVLSEITPFIVDPQTPPPISKWL